MHAMLWVSLLSGACLLVGVASAQAESKDEGTSRPPRGLPFAGERPTHRIEAPNGGPGMGGNRGGVRDVLERYREQNPEEFERLRKLREEDPETFRTEMQERMRERFGAAMQARNSEFDRESTELAAQYRQAKTDEERAVLKAKIEAAVQAAFDRRIEANREMIKNLEDQISRLKEQVSERESRRQEICSKRLEELIGDPGLKW